MGRKIWVIRPLWRHFIPFFWGRCQVGLVFIPHLLTRVVGILATLASNRYPFLLENSAFDTTIRRFHYRTMRGKGDFLHWAFGVAGINSLGGFVILLFSTL
ncbi:hypothetical protein F5Y06DRAFT_33237 [Hypoxylon sp. FL0890]|nr:hypothetical protein F5Y06DRAFT_33237 [Hypoxylon sp. FL0890]